MDVYETLKTDLISILRLAEKTLRLSCAQIDLCPGYLGRLKSLATFVEETMSSTGFVDPIISELARSVMRAGEMRTLDSDQDHGKISSYPSIELDRDYVGVPLISNDRKILGCLSAVRDHTKETPKIDRDSLTGFAQLISRQLTQFAERNLQNLDLYGSKSYEQTLVKLSRELRKPLNPMLIETTSLIEDSDDPAWLLYLFRMKRNIEQICDKLDDLQGLERTKQSTLPSNAAAIDLHHLISELVTRAESEMSGPASSIVCRLGASDYLVRSDRAALEHVILNCLRRILVESPNSNVLESRVETSNTKPGLVHLEIYTAPKNAPIFSNTDTTADHVLSSPVGHELEKTAGPILEVTTGVFNAHGMHIERIVDDRDVPLGYRIELHLELYQSVGHSPQSSEPELPADSESIAGTQAPAPTRILLVEDNPDTLRYLTGFLQSKGHEVIQASTIAEAIEQSRLLVFDAIVSDIELPDGSGLALKRERELVGIPGIAMSGFGGKEDLLASRDAGFHTHLIKPLNVRKLHESILEALFEANSRKTETA